MSKALPKFISRCHSRNTTWDSHENIPKKSLMYWKTHERWAPWGGLEIYQIIDGMMVLRDNQELLDEVNREANVIVS